MCIGTPVQVIATAPWRARCLDRHGESVDVDTRLVDEVCCGQWLLVFNGAARRILHQEEAANMVAALQGLEAAMTGCGDPLAGFADLLSRSPELPEHLKK
ncbi:MAG: HypC/HybG/HupF family hydrogenase formation chaperone [Enterobacteriaceae bacterium]